MHGGPNAAGRQIMLDVGVSLWGSQLWPGVGFAGWTQKESEKQ